MDAAALAATETLQAAGRAYVWLRYAAASGAPSVNIVERAPGPAPVPSGGVRLVDGEPTLTIVRAGTVAMLSGTVPAPLLRGVAASLGP